MNKVFIKLDRGAEIPVKANVYDRGYDVKCIETPTVEIHNGEPVLIYKTGISLQVPLEQEYDGGLEASPVYINLYARSSITTSVNLLLSNNVGIVDGKIQ